MDNKERPYRAVSVDMIGVENGAKRFTQDGNTQLPPIARWRNNLTAMSQHDNLFFIASGDCIAVYQPEFPYQTLKRHPALLIRPELANPHALGYLSHPGRRAEGHCINHLIVKDLGSQEILLLATDSGNVEAYYTASVLDAIHEFKRNGLERKFADSVGLRPFFKYWVCQSVWGLDIHKDARMIAVSSNVPSANQPSDDLDDKATITVFAFALAHASVEAEEDSEEEDDEDTLETDWTDWNTHRDSEVPERVRNYKVVLKGFQGHTNNIPNVSFVNSAEDSDGIWLLSTDITGTMKLWQIWKGTCLRQWDFSNDESRTGGWARPAYPGWSVATLDVSIFRPVSTIVEFIGAERAPVHYGYHDRGPSYNLTAIARQIPENSRYHPSHGERSPEVDEHYDEDQIFDHPELDLEDPFSDEDDVMEDIQPTNPAQDPSLNPPRPDDDQYDPRTAQFFEIPLEFEYERELDDSDISSDDSERSDDNGVYDSVQPGSGLHPMASRRIAEMRSKVKPYQLPDVPTPPEIAMIHCSNTSIRLLGSPRSRFPHIFCANVVRQAIPERMINTFQPLAELHLMERLNMIQTIPELGILLVATQAGRVAVCSLTRRGDMLGFRVDWVLPTKKQEQSGHRPNLSTLLGIAVAPIQGGWASSLDSNDDDEEKSMLRDGMIDGVKTSFDPNVIVLRHRPTSKERKAEKLGESPDAAVELKPWKKAPREIPAWQAVEPSMRYRVMLTYTDLSVLTYELSRDVEKGYEAE